MSPAPSGAVSAEMASCHNVAATVAIAASSRVHPPAVSGRALHLAVAGQREVVIMSSCGHHGAIFFGGHVLVDARNCHIRGSSTSKYSVHSKYSKYSTAPLAYNTQSGLSPREVPFR